MCMSRFTLREGCDPLRKKSTYAALLGIICLGIIIRYPRVPHGVGVDAYLFSVLASSIVDQGYVAWIVHPLSPFGLYPLSYPSASFVLVADLSMTASAPMELTTLVASQVIAVSGILFAVLMARGFSKSNTFALSVALLFAMMPKFVTNTIWEVPTRGLFMAVTPLFIWAVIRTIKSRRLIDMSMVFVFSLLMLLSHRLAILVFVVFFAFVIALIFVVSGQVIRRQFPEKFLSPSFRRASRNLALPFYAGILLITLFGSGVLDSYREGAVFSSDNPMSSFGNLAVSVSRSVGFLSPLAFLGVAVATRARNKSPAEYLMLSAPAALVPTLFLRDYTGYYLVTFFALFIGMGVAFLMVRTPGRLRPAVATALLVVVIASAAFAVDLELPRQSHMTEAQYSTGLYIRYQVPGTVASNDGLLAVRVATVSCGPVLPIGGATTATYGPDALAFGFVRGFAVVPVSVWDLTVDSDSIYLPIEVTVGADWSVMLSLPMDARSFRIASRYNVTAVLEDTGRPAVYYTGWGVVYESPFLMDAYRYRYKTYDAGGVRIWALT